MRPDQAARIRRACSNLIIERLGEDGKKCSLRVTNGDKLLFKLFDKADDAQVDHLDKVVRDVTRAFGIDVEIRRPERSAVR